MTYLGYRHPPKRITEAAVKLVTTYTAVEVNDFFACFLNFCELEEEDMTIKFIEAHGVDAPPKDTLPEDAGRSIAFLFHLFPWYCCWASGFWSCRARRRRSTVLGKWMMKFG